MLCLKSFYEQFKWDSIFRPSYTLIELEEHQNQIVVTVAQRNVRNTFLKNNPLVTRYKISFTSGKISKLEELDYVGASMGLWIKKRDSLVDWIAKNHPTLDGFIYDMTMHGALNYVKAIELYENEKRSN